MLATIMWWFVTFLITFGYGVWIFIKAFVEDCKRDLRRLNKMAMLKKPKTEHVKQLNTFIRSHSNLKRLSLPMNILRSSKTNKPTLVFSWIDDITDIFENPILFDFIGSTITISILMILIQGELVE